MYNLLLVSYFSSLASERKLTLLGLAKWVQVSNDGKNQVHTELDRSAFGSVW